MWAYLRRWSDGIDAFCSVGGRVVLDEQRSTVDDQTVAEARWSTSPLKNSFKIAGRYDSVTRHLVCEH